MPKLIENVLIGERVRLAGEEISEADAKDVRPEVFSTGSAPASEDQKDAAAEGNSPADSDHEASTEDAPASDEETAKPRSRGKRTSSK